MTDRDGYTFAEAAARIGVSAKTLKREVKDGRLLAIKEGRGWRIPASAWEDYLARCRWEALPRPEQKRRIWIATLGPNPAHETLLAPDSVRANRMLFPYSGPAVYFLYQGDEIVYVGQTVNLWSRVSSHCGQKIFDHFSYIACAAEELNELERRAIIKFQPKLNRA